VLVLAGEYFDDNEPGVWLFLLRVGLPLMLALAGIVVIIASFFANQTVNCQIYRPIRWIQKSVNSVKNLNLSLHLAGAQGPRSSHRVAGSAWLRPLRNLTHFSSKMGCYLPESLCTVSSKNN